MATLKPKHLYIGNATGSNIYTAGSNVGDYTIIKLINVCNYDAANVKTFSINLLTPSNNTAQSNNLIISNIAVPPNNVVQIDTALIIETSCSLYISHSGNITTTLSGVEFK